jgi:hypothetical protein
MPEENSSDEPKAIALEYYTRLNTGGNILELFAEDACCFFLFSSRRLARVGLRATAEVVELRRRRSGSDDGGRDAGVYHPVVVFRAVGGQEVRAAVRAGSGCLPGRLERRAGRRGP